MIASILRCFFSHLENDKRLMIIQGVQEKKHSIFKYMVHMTHYTEQEKFSKIFEMVRDFIKCQGYIEMERGHGDTFYKYSSK